MITTDVSFLVAIATGISLGMLLLAIAIWWKIFGKAGYPGWLAILMLVPLANLIAMLVLAFGDWPVHGSFANFGPERTPVGREDIATN